MEGEGSSVQSTIKGEEDDVIAEGRRAMACKDYPQAVDAFEKACKVISDKYGPVSDEMGDPSFLYGKALLELARMENALFGSGVPQQEEGDDEEDSEDDDQETAMSNVSDHAPSQSEDTVGPSSSIEGNGGVSVGVASEQIPADENNDDPTNLQLAWEMFEIARVIYQKSNTLEGKLKLADVNSFLGEVSLESDQYEQAIEDLTMSLKIRELVLKDYDRLLAETHFHLGLAQTYAMNFDEAVREYEYALQVLNLKKEILENQLKEEGGEESEEAIKIKQEIFEINELLPDIDSKITDVYEVKKKALSEALESFSHPQQPPAESVPRDTPTQQPQGSAGSSSQDSSSSTQPTPVNDISHLVRKKTKVNSNHNPTAGSSKPLVVKETDGEAAVQSNKRKRAVDDNGCSSGSGADEEPGMNQTEAKKTCVTTEQ